MVDRRDLCKWLVSALNANNGRASIIEICKYVWSNYENVLKESGDLFFSWQYDIRWAATKLRAEGVMRPANLSSKGIWELV